MITCPKDCPPFRGRMDGSTYAYAPFMIKRILLFVAFTLPFFVGSLRAADAPALADELERYAQTAPRNHYRVANDIFANWLAESADTLYTFSSKDDINYVDGMIYYWSSFALYTAEDYEKALSLNLQAESAWSKLDSVIWYSDCLFHSSSIYISLGDFTKAAEYAERTLSLDRTLNDSTRLSSSLSNTAFVWVYAGKPEVGEKYILESLQIERKLKRPHHLAVRLGIASEILVQIKKLDQALEYAKEALDLETKHGDRRSVPVRRSQYAAALFANHHYEEARDEALEASDSLLAVGNYSSLQINYRLLADIESQLGNQNYAVDYLKRSLDLCRKQKNTYQEAQSLHKLAILLQKSDPAQSAGYWEQYATLNEKIFNDKMSSRLQAFDVQYDMSRHQAQMEMQERLIYFHRVMLAILIVIIVGCLLLVALLIRLVRQRGENNKMLQKTNEAKDELLRMANDEKLQAESARQQILEVVSRFDRIVQRDDVELSTREAQIVKMLCQGLLTKEVAEQLNISIRTVETHKNHIYRKLGVSNTVELLRYAERNRLV